MSFGLFAELVSHTDSRYLDFHSSGLCTLPHLLRFLRELRRHCSHESFGKTLATITIRQTLLAKGLSFEHLKSWLEVVPKSPLRRKGLVTVTHQNGFASRIITWPANLMSRECLREPLKSLYSIKWSI